MSLHVTDETSEDSKENGDSCVGDTPDIVYAMKPLTQTKEPLDSDEEDAAILIAAANGNLSPIEASITARPAKAKNRTRKRSRVLRGTSGLADIKSRAAKKATNFTPKLGARKTKAAKKKVQQLHLTKPPKKKQLKGVPKVKDELLCCVQFFGSYHQLQCEVVGVEEVHRLENGKLSCKIRAMPSSKTDEVESLIVHLDSAGERNIGSPLKESRTWARIIASSPKAATIKASAFPGATEAHDKAIKNTFKISPGDSIQILSNLKGDLKPKTDSPRRRLRPCHLSYEGKVLRSAEKDPRGDSRTRYQVNVKVSWT